MIDKHKILKGIVDADDSLVRVKVCDMDCSFEDIALDEKGGIVGNLVVLGDRYGVEDLDEDPNVVVIREKFPIEKVMAVVNLRYQPIIVLKK